MNRAVTAAPPEPAAAGGRARRLDPFEWGTLAALTVLGFGVVAWLLIRASSDGGVFAGADGFLVADPAQYLNWGRQAGEHGLIANLYDLAPGHRDFLHPGLLVSGLVWLATGSVPLAYLIWKPVAIAALFLGALLYTRRFLPRTGDRRLALVLALFACSPVAALVGWGKLGGPGDKYAVDFITGELWTGSFLWGYLFTAIAVGLLPLALLAYERGRDGGPRRMLAWAALAGLFVSWFQPWQGATLALILVGAEALALRRGRTLRRAVLDLMPVLAAIAVPAVYYWALGRWDSSWALAAAVNDLPRWPSWVLLAGPVTLTVPALLGYRVSPRDWGDLALRVWPAAALLIYFQPAGTFPFHAWQGLTLPLVVLAMVGVRSLLADRPLRLWWAVAAVALLVVVGTAYRVDQLGDAIRIERQPFVLTTGERDALRYLDARPGPGGVLAPVYSGILVPAYTGRETWIGAGSWTPDFAARNDATERLFGGELSPAEAAAVVRRSGARWLLSDCHGRADIRATLAGVAGPPVRFGCATVWPVR